MTVILMLDSDVGLASAVTRSLAQEGMRVVSAADVQDALSRIGSEPYHAVLLDGDLVDAEELARFCVVPVILTTSFSERDGGHRFSRDARLLPKPFTNAQLLSALHEACGAPDLTSESLVDLLRRAHSAGQSVALRIGAGSVFVEHGELVHAELAGLVGERALAQVLAQTQRVPVVIPQREVTRTIQRPFRALMLDMLRHIEEQELLAPAQLEASQVRPIDKGTRT
jgi:DNA-binding response OmpR family regulator